MTLHSFGLRMQGSWWIPTTQVSKFKSGHHLLQSSQTHTVLLRSRQPFLHAQGPTGNRPPPSQPRHWHQSPICQDLILRVLRVFEMVTTHSRRTRSILLTTLMSGFRRWFLAYANHYKREIRKLISQDLPEFLLQLEVKHSKPYKSM